MKKFFPNMETAIIFVFLICIGLWGMSRCKKKKEEAAISTATEGSISPLDTLSSPAASRPRIPTQPTTTTTAATTTTQTPLPPQYQQSPVPLPATPTNAPTPTVQTNVPQPYSVVTTSPATAKTTAPPVVTSKGVPQTTTTPPSNTMLYVLINGLNIRSKPDLKSKVKGKLKINDQVYFLEEVTEETQTVRLANGTSVTKPWFKVQTKRGTVGWVHGSGVDFYKRKPTDGF
jgi:Bacterial SH3 domain